MSIDILMPALSPTMEEGTLSKWLIKEGDQVVSGDLIAEIETDKATMEVESIEDGTVGKLLVQEGEEGIKVNSPIAILLFDGETISDHKKNDDVKEVKKELSKIDLSEDKIPKTSKETLIDDYDDQVIDEKLNSKRIFATPLAKRLAKQKDIDLSLISGSGPNGRILKFDIQSLNDRKENIIINNSIDIKKFETV